MANFLCIRDFCKSLVILLFPLVLPVVYSQAGSAANNSFIFSQSAYAANYVVDGTNNWASFGGNLIPGDSLTIENTAALNANKQITIIAGDSETPVKIISNKGAQITDLSIVVKGSVERLNIEFTNLNFRSGTPNDAIRLLSTCPNEININVIGTCVVTGVNCSSSAKGGSAIKYESGSAVSLLVTGEGSLSLTGGNGYNSTNINYKNGLSAIDIGSGNFGWTGSGDLTITGGRGGTMITSGALGGNGGIGINAGSVNLSGSGNLSVTAGSAGASSNNSGVDGSPAIFARGDVRIETPGGAATITGGVAGAQGGGNINGRGGSAIYAEGFVALDAVNTITLTSGKNGSTGIYQPGGGVATVEACGISFNGTGDITVNRGDNYNGDGGHGVKITGSNSVLTFNTTGKITLVGGNAALDGSMSGAAICMGSGGDTGQKIVLTAAASTDPQKYSLNSGQAVEAAEKQLDILVISQDFVFENNTTAMASITGGKLVFTPPPVIVLESAEYILDGAGFDLTVTGITPDLPNIYLMYRRTGGAGDWLTHIIPTESHPTSGFDISEFLDSLGKGTYSFRAFLGSDGKVTGSTEIQGLDIFGPPVLSGDDFFSPANGATLVDVETGLSLTFDEPVLKGTEPILSIYDGGGELFESFTAEDIAVAGSTATFIPTNNFLYETEYYVVMSEGAFVRASQPQLPCVGFSDASVWRFTTLADPNDPDDPAGPGDPDDPDGPGDPDDPDSPGDPDDPDGPPAQPPILYSLLLKSEPGGRVTTGPSLKLKSGAQIEIEAIPNNGYRFKEWKATAGFFQNPFDSRTQFTMPDSSAEITASFEKETEPWRPEPQPPSSPGTTSRDSGTRNNRDTFGEVSPVQRSGIIINGAPMGNDKITLALSEGRIVLNAETPTGEDGAVSTVLLPVSELMDILESFRQSLDGPGNNAAEIITIQTGFASYELPADLSKIIDGFSRLVEENPGCSLKIQITRQQVTPPALQGVEFQIFLVDKDGKTIVEPETFRDYVVRTIFLRSDITGRVGNISDIHVRKSGRDKKQQFVPHKIMKTSGGHEVRILSRTNSVYTVFDGSGIENYPDVTEGAWFSEYIRRARVKGLVEGEYGLFHPRRNVTRSEFTRMVAQTLQLPPAVNDRQNFSDVGDETKWYFDVVSRGFSAGILGGFEGDKFLPDKPITRQEMASILARAAVYEDVKPSIPGNSIQLFNIFNDYDRIDPRYLKDIQAVYELGLMRGTAEDMFSPEDEATRAEAATVLINMCVSFGLTD